MASWLGFHWTTMADVHQQEEQPPEGIRNPHQYDVAEDFSPEISKYWEQRHKIWSKYEEGVWMTDDAWFGVTPEPIANQIAEHVSSAPKTKTCIIDAFAGAGGNTIAFARSGRWSQIFAVEKDPKVLACAKHNAKVYGVANKIWWIEGDIFVMLKDRLRTLDKNTIVFGSPPWGGKCNVLFVRGQRS